MIEKNEKESKRRNKCKCVWRDVKKNARNKINF